MMKTEIKAIAGFEKEFEDFNNRKELLKAEIEQKKAEAVAKVEADYSVINEKLDNLIAQVSEQVEVEVPDVEEQEVVENSVETGEVIY